MNHLFFDHNSTTPLCLESIQTIQDSVHLFGNPSSTHCFGYSVKEKLKEAKGELSLLLGSTPDHFLFTSGGTESNNLVINSVLSSASKKQPIHVITSCIEHPSVLKPIEAFLGRGVDVTYLPVNSQGRICIDDLKKSIRSNTTLITIMMANNEIGSIQPIQDIAQVARDHRIFCHTDAVQAIGKLDVSIDSLGVDSMSISGHKFYGPKGIGVLYLRNPLSITPLIHGGGQEQDIRSGTENTLGILGISAATNRLNQTLDADINHYLTLKSHFIRRVRQDIPSIVFNGMSDSCDHQKTLANTVSLRFDRIRGEALTSILSDSFNIAISNGSACSSNSAKISHVLTSIGLSDHHAKSSLRISFGISNTINDVNQLVDQLSVCSQMLEKMSVV